MASPRFVSGSGCVVSHWRDVFHPAKTYKPHGDDAAVAYIVRMAYDMLLVMGS